MLAPCKQCGAQLLHPLHGPAPVDETVEPLGRNACLPNRTAGDTTDDCSRRVCVTAAVDDRDDPLPDVALMPQPRVNGGRYGVIDVAAN